MCIRYTVDLDPLYSCPIGPCRRDQYCIVHSIISQHPYQHQHHMQQVTNHLFHHHLLHNNSNIIHHHYIPHCVIWVALVASLEICVIIICSSWDQINSNLNKPKTISNRSGTCVKPNQKRHLLLVLDLSHFPPPSLSWLCFCPRLCLLNIGSFPNPLSFNCAKELRKAFKLKHSNKKIIKILLAYSVIFFFLRSP